MVIGTGGSPHPVAPAENHRQAFVQWLLWGVKHHDQVGHHDQIGYAFIGTYPRGLKAGTLPLNVSCSGFVTVMAEWAGCPDPNGLHFGGLAYTGYMLSHCEGISREQATSGDLAVLGPGNGDHVVSLVTPRRADGDFGCVSHGKPGDPWQTLLSVEAAAHPSPTRFLRFLPAT